MQMSVPLILKGKRLWMICAAILILILCGVVSCANVRKEPGMEIYRCTSTEDLTSLINERFDIIISHPSDIDSVTIYPSKYGNTMFVELTVPEQLVDSIFANYQSMEKITSVNGLLFPTGDQREYIEGNLDYYYSTLNNAVDKKSGGETTRSLRAIFLKPTDSKIKIYLMCTHCDWD